MTIARLGKTSRKQQVEATATKLFREKGYSASSMRDLAQSLGIEAASIYSHVKSKEEILRKICFDLAHRFFASKDEIENQKLDPASKLEAAIKAHIAVITAHTDSSVVFLNEWRHLSEPYLTDFLKMRKDYEDWFVGIIDQGISKAEFAPMNQKFAVLTVLSGLNWVANWYRTGGEMSLDEIQKELTQFIISGLKKSAVKQ